jgi:hypothetical protein
MSKPIKLESNPIEYDYEDYISAYFQSGGLYVERSIIHRETEEILELDIITTDFLEDSATKNLVEIKSGKWGFSEIFKVKGWLVYLKIDTGIFIVKKEKDSFKYFEKKSEELGISLINNSDLKKTNDSLEKFLHQKADDNEIETLRFSYLLERKLLKKIKDLKKQHPNNQGYKNLDDYFFKVNSGSFFSNNPIKRIKQLFDTFLKYKNLTAKICYELENGVYKDDIEILSTVCFKETFYKASNSPLQISLYIEHISRVTILKSCIEHLIKNHKGFFGKENFLENIDYLSIPETIKNGLNEIVSEPFFHRYPIFWQFFTYVMGGFILTDLREKEYKYISKNTGIPFEYIPIAFDSYNKLFPKQNGWMHKLPKSNIECHRFFSLPFSGLGANHRRFIHLPHLSEENQTYAELEKMISGDKTMADLSKWNNLGYEILK